jgi:metal-dependent HD superfamily phosphatase/phosphodiesterase
MLLSLPKSILEPLNAKINTTPSLLATLLEPTQSAHSQLRALLHQGIGNVVHRSSLHQTAKNIATAGVAKSLRYAFRKVQKKILAQ